MNECVDFYKNVEEYKLILSHVEFDLNNNDFTEEMGLKLNMSVSDIDKEEINNILTLAVSTNVSACEKGKEDSDFFNLNIMYAISIFLNKKTNIDIDDKSKSDMIVEYALGLLHPELRTMVNSIVNRLGLPNIDIPLKVIKSHDNRN